MIISSVKVLELNEKYDLVSDLSERELNNPEGVGLDIRFGEVHKLTSGGFLGVKDRKTPDIEKVADINDGDKELVLKPGDYYLLTTMETIHSPAERIELEEGAEPVYLVPTIYPRSTLQRSGLILRATKTDPGYKGKLTFGLHNAGGQEIKLELGARIANLVFTTAIGELSRAYEGQWQGGRVAAVERETQN